jgi:hypothetical protein
MILAGRVAGSLVLRGATGHSGPCEEICELTEKL